MIGEAAWVAQSQISGNQTITDEQKIICTGTDSFCVCLFCKLLIF